MGNISTHDADNDQSTPTKNYYDIIDILASADESKLEFFIGEEGTRLNYTEFSFYATDSREFKVDYGTDGTVKIYLQLATDEVINEVRDSVGSIIIKTGNKE
ncbi:hypothetical protein KBB89_00170 [Candidatus Gracilibacteria bacterium]|nr:hypothetical protein [Candidatus Gracilibacteria bacterium]